MTPKSVTEAAELEYNPDTCNITLKGKIVAEWNDEAIWVYPEDLTWSRDIGALANKLFRAGYDFAKSERTYYGDNHLLANENTALKSRVEALEAVLKTAKTKLSNDRRHSDLWHKIFIVLR